MADLLNSENVKWINEIKEELKASVGKPIIRKEWDVLLSRTEISKYYRKPVTICAPDIQFPNEFNNFTCPKCSSKPTLGGWWLHHRHVHGLSVGEYLVQKRYKCKCPSESGGESTFHEALKVVLTFDNVPDFIKQAYPVFLLHRSAVTKEVLMLLVSSHIGSPVPAISTASSQQDIRNLIPTTSHSAIQASASHTQGLNAPTTTTSFIPQQQVHVVAVDNTSQGNGEETMDIDEDGSQSTNANTLNVYSATSGTEENSGLTLSPPPKFVFTINSVHSVNEIVSLQLPEPTSGYSIDEIDLLEGVYQHFQASCKSGTNINWKALTSKYWYYAKRFSLEHPNRFKIFNREEGAFLAWAKKKIGNLKK